MIFILGIDALDYELVEKLNLNNLKQIEYDKIFVPIDEVKGSPLSPEVWASFLVGRKISVSFKKSYNYLKLIRKITDFLNIDLSIGFFRKVKLTFLKLFTAPRQYGYLTEKTFLDMTKSYEINVPFYNFDNKTFDAIYLWEISKLSLAQTIKEFKSIYEKRKIQIITDIDEINDYELFFAYIHVIDVLQHFLFLHVSDIEKYYIDLDNFVSILKRKLEDSFGEIIFIIVSDHGFDFKIGNHSMKGFYSSNINLIPKPKNITDFYGIILDRVKKNNELSNS